MLSIIIPARNEKYLEKTIRNVLDNADGEIEVIAILDGYLPEKQINMNDNRVIFIHNQESIGQRQSINQGARMAKGEYVMKLDAHCAVDKGFDVVLARDCEYDMTMIPRMYNLDVTTWKPKLHKRTDYMYITSPQSEKPFRAAYYGSKQPKNDKMIDDIMCCMGPGFFMHKDRFWELGGCDEGHGGWGQQGIEVACKAWLSGGRLVVNKNTWFAHWFRGGGVPAGEKPGFPYRITGKEVDKARKHSQDLWLNNKWEKQVRDFQWMVDKFNPPGWEEIVDTGYPYMKIPYNKDKTVLDLGAGKRPRRKGITNVDCRELDNIDVVADLMNLPFDDNSVDCIISSDVVEHFGRWEFKPLIEEWKRVLKPGGKAMISTVDIGKTIDKMNIYPVRKWLDAFYGGQKYPTDFHKNGWTREMFVNEFKNMGWIVEGIRTFTLHRNPRMVIFIKKQ